MPYQQIEFKEICFDSKVQTYCVSPGFKCPNYKHSWTCPPEAPFMEDIVSKYKIFFLVYSEFNLAEYVRDMKKKYPRRSEYKIRNSFYMKGYLRDDLEKEIFKFTENYNGNFEEKLILWDGHCRICQKFLGKSCTYSSNKPCRYPDKKRYSMEAVGIDVTKTVKQLNLKIEWPPINYYYRFGLICFK